MPKSEKSFYLKIKITVAKSVPKPLYLNFTKILSSFLVKNSWASFYEPSRLFKKERSFYDKECKNDNFFSENINFVERLSNGSKINIIPF